MEELDYHGLGPESWPTQKYYRVHVNTGHVHDLSPISLKLHSITECFSDEYILPARSIQNIFKVLTDESAFKGHYGVSVVLMRWISPVEMEQKYEQPLEELCRQYKIDCIHFRDIFGENILGSSRNHFLKKFVEIVSPANLKAYSLSSEKKSLIAQSPSYLNVTDKELFFVIFWNVLEYLVALLPPGSIFHIYWERDNNVSWPLAHEYVNRLYEGLTQCFVLKRMLASICRHPVFFSKKALFCSSVADLAAYANNLVQQKIDNEIPLKKIKSRYKDIMDFTMQVFNYEFASLVSGSKLGMAQLAKDKRNRFR